MIQFKSLVNYYLREKQWRTAITCCNEESKKGKDPCITFYRSIANFKEGSIIEAIRDVKQSQINRDFKYASTCALIHYHESSPAKDDQELSSLYLQLDKIKSDGKLILPSDVINTMRLYFYLNELDKFYDCEDLLEQFQLKSTDGEDLLIKGWNLCYSDNPEEIAAGNEFFNNYFKEFGNSNLDAIMGNFKCLERLKKNEEVLDKFSSITTDYKNFPPLLIEKAKIFLNLSDFENAMEFIRTDVRCAHFEIPKIMAICYLVNDGDFKEAAENIENMWKMISQQEPNNPELYYETAKLFSRTCDRSLIIIDKCERMIDKAISYNIKNAEYLIEKGYYKLIKNDLLAAEKLFSEAVSINPKNNESRVKLIDVKIRKGEFKEAKLDINSLILEFSTSNPIPAQLLYLDAVVKAKDFEVSSESRGENSLKIIEERFSPLIGEILNVHVNYAKRFYFTKYDIITATNYDFLCDIASLGLSFFHINSTENKFDVNNLPSIITKSKKIIDSIIKNKYFISASLLYAKLKFITRDKQSAINYLEGVLKKDPINNLDAYILYIMITNENKDFRKSKELINDALLNCSAKAKKSINFWIQKTYMELGMEDLKIAETSLSTALKLIDEINNTNIKSNENIQSNSGSIFEFQANDKFILMKLQVQIYLKLDKIKEAKEIITLLIAENPNLGDDILIMQSDIAIKEKDYKTAASMLKKIKPEPAKEELYTTSRMKLADIYLTSLMDRRLYSWCYSEILDNFKNLENLKLAASAEMKIDSPDRAIIYYKEAILINPDDVLLLRDLGRAMVQTHDYSSAEIYYQDTLNNVSEKLNERNVLNYYEIVVDYVKMMHKLASSDIKKNSDLASILDGFITLLRKYIIKFQDQFKLKEKLALLLYTLANASRVIKVNCPTNQKENLNNPLISNAIKNLEEAAKLMKEVNVKLRDKSQEEVLNKNKAFISEIYFISGLYIQTVDSNLELAEKNYLESLNHSSNTSEKALKKLIEVYLLSKKLNDAQKYADMLIRLNENSEENIKILVTVISNRKNNEAASIYLEEIITKKQNSFKLIEVYIELVRRIGKISKVKEILNKIEKMLKFTYSPGLNYCKGLYLKYTYQTNLALEEFSKIKTDEYYGVKCIEQMLDLYINPDGNILMLELVSPYSNDANKKSGVLEYATNDINFEAVKFLLKELLIKRDDDNSRIYECWVSLLIRDEGFINKAIDKLKDMLTRDPENVSAWILLALSHLVLHNENEAKTNLKILEKSVNNIKYYNDYERGYLLLGYMAMRGGNISKANESLKKAIEINMSQIKAYEYLGMIYEKENNYKEACNFFEKAWEFSSNNSAVIGYKLAICYLNNRNPIKAVNICNEVKKKFPDYPIDELTLKAKNVMS